VIAVAYFDTSALLKHYVREIGSGWVNALFASSPAPIIFTSQLTVVEAVCAFSRRLREGALSSEAYSRLLTAFDYDVSYKYVIADVMPIAIDAACQLAGRHPLRAYDALHLATAWLINRELVQNGKSPLIFICADDRLASISKAEGLLMENPNRHPIPD